jgi:hypothetical protein
MSHLGLVSRVTPVHTAQRNCTRDGGWPFEFGNQVMIAGITLAVVSNGVAFAGPLEDAYAAYNRGDYATAVQLFKPLAVKGNVAAQTNVGWMFQNGQGVLRDYDEAIKWYRLAAAQGDVYAQRISA